MKQTLLAMAVLTGLFMASCKEGSAGMRSEDGMPTKIGSFRITCFNARSEIWIEKYADRWRLDGGGILFMVAGKWNFVTGDCLVEPAGEGQS